MNRLLFAIYLILLAVFPLSAQYNIRHYSVEDGLSQNTVMSILQDRDGYMWFGTWDGINKFDGYKFVTYKSRPGEEVFQNNRIEYILEDSLGYIWFQTYDGRFHRFDKSVEQVHTLSYTMPLHRLDAQDLIIEPRSGELYLRTYQGIVHVSETDNGILTDRVYPYKTSDIAHFITHDNKGRVWYDDRSLLCSIDIGSGVCDSVDLSSIETGAELNVSLMLSDGIWFGGNHGMLWRRSLANKTLEPVSLSSDAEVVDMVRLSAYELMAATRNHGLFVYNSMTGSLVHVADFKTIGQINALYSDSKGMVWIETDDLGIWRFRPADRSLKHLKQQIDRRYGPLHANMLLIEDNDHNTWVNPLGGGLSRYNHETDELENPVTGITNMVHTAYADRNGEIWLATYQTGIDCLSLRQQQFRLCDMRQSASDIGEVRAMLLLSDGNTVLANKDNRLASINNEDLLTTDKSKDDMTVYCMLEDLDGSLLLGTRYNGLFRLNKHKLQDINVASDGSRITNKAIYDLLPMPWGDIYVGTYGGGINLIRRGSDVANYTIFSPLNGWTDYPVNTCSRVRCLLNVSDTMLLAGTTNGLLQVRFSDHKTWFTPYCDVHCLLQDSRGDIWMGTFSGGLNKILKLADDDSPAQFEAYTVKSGLRSDIVLSIAEDKNGRIWFTSESNVTRYDPVSHIFQHFFPFESVHDGYFTECKALTLPSGDISFGYSNGYCTFSPERILRSEGVPPLHLTGLSLFNTEVGLGDGSPLKKSISATDELTLTYKQSVWSIEYAAIDFLNAAKIDYAFKLDGFEKDWNYVHKQRKATYTNLPPGKYVFRVRSTNAEGVWVANERTLTVHILPSFWQTGWAWLLYLLIAAMVLLVVYLIVSRYNRLQQQMQVEQQVTDFRLRFFTNISHELRTPLTLISGPVENILKTEKLNNSMRTQLEIVHSNARRMLRLINEILDFRKIQNHKMRLKIQQTEFRLLVEETCGNFNKEAYDKHINFRLENDVPDAKLWIDREKVDIIIYNLLCNAFKFTPAGKSITVRVSEKKDFVLLQVVDEGVGIPHEKRNILFERFSSHNEIENLAGKAGTGIGLNLVKELVDLHKGYIEVESETGNGATFTVMFRKGKEHFGNEVDFVMSSELLPHTNDVMQPRLDNVVIKQKLPKMLVVEDNEDMCSFLGNIFSQNFTVLSAKDGLEGLRIVRETCPDIVVTDLMMPNMDGLELTDHIKKEEPTSHIPVILLTAKEAIESRLEAMRFGADDYITKPFSAEYLKARVDNILKQRERLSERYRNDLLTLKAAPLKKEKSPDEIFLAKLLDFMERNMDNNELVVEEMVSDMAMGRTVFFNKLKNLTGLSPVEFIREVRIKRAAQLLETGAYNVTEVTYMVGMNDSRYFSKCFKAVYGMTPTEYKRQKLENV